MIIIFHLVEVVKPLQTKILKKESRLLRTIICIKNVLNCRGKWVYKYRGKEFKKKKEKTNCDQSKVPRSLEVEHRLGLAARSLKGLIHACMLFRKSLKNELRE